MSIDTLNTTEGVSLAPADRQEADRAEIVRLAQQFEAMLMTQMLREMRRSMLDEDDKENGFDASPLMQTGDLELGLALSRAGGLGLSTSLIDAFERQLTTEAGRAGGAGRVDGTDRAGKTGEAGRVGGVDGAGQADEAGENGEFNEISPLPALPAAPALPTVSSRFGWRSDPLTGAARFHQGVDLAVAYGQDVKAAAAGTVSFAGTQRGYGHTVVIDHEGGRQTRYAHLSEQLVRAGDVVAEGQIVARSGNSGRSTGPHLHFEMLVNGRAVDPMRAGTD